MSISWQAHAIKGTAVLLGFCLGYAGYAWGHWISAVTGLGMIANALMGA